jgi:hypothetical protein
MKQPMEDSLERQAKEGLGREREENLKSLADGASYL